MSTEEPKPNVLDEFFRTAGTPSSDTDELELDVAVEALPPRRSAPPPPPSARASRPPPPSSRRADEVSGPKARSSAPPPPSRAGLGVPRSRAPLPPPSLRMANVLREKSAPRMALPPPSGPETTADIDSAWDAVIAPPQPEQLAAPAPEPPKADPPRVSLEPPTGDPPPAYAELARATSSPDLATAVAAESEDAPVPVPVPAPLPVVAALPTAGEERAVDDLFAELSDEPAKLLLPVSAEDLSRAPVSGPSQPKPEAPPPLPPLPALKAEVPPAPVLMVLAKADESIGETDLTRPLSRVEVARIEEATGDGEPTRVLSLVLPDAAAPDAMASDADLTRPLPPLSDVAPAPYASDTDLTRPLVSMEDPIRLERRSSPPPAPPRSLARPSVPPPAPPPSLARPSAPPPAPPPSLARPSAPPPAPPMRVGRTLPPPPLALPVPAPVPLIVAVPPRRAGAVEHAPSIQIARSNDSEFTPTTQLDRPISSTPPAGAGRLPTLPRIPPPARIPAEFGGRGSNPSMNPVTGSVPPPGRGMNRWAMALAAIALGVLALVIGLRPRAASLVITAAGESGEPVPSVAIRVDGVERCRSVPCEVKDLGTGTHFVSASSGDGQGVERAVVLESGEHAAHHVVLSAPARREAGLNVVAVGESLRVLVDGKDLGAPPVSLDGVAPGSHTVRVVGREPYYEAYEERVTLEPGEVRSLGPVRLRVRVGRLELRGGEGSEDASVSVDGRPIAHLPAVLQLSADQSHEVVATRSGFGDFIHQVVFDGVAERRVDVTLEPAEGGAPVAAAPRRLAGGNARARSAVQRPSSTGGAGTLDLMSTPRAAVVVNGKPMGQTPLRGIRVPAGTQSIVFVHPELGRQVRSAVLAPGGRTAVGVKF